MSPAQVSHPHGEAVSATAVETPTAARTVESRLWSKTLPSAGPRLRICIASFEILGPHRNGGIGTAYTKLAALLSATGHEVTLLYTQGRHSLTQPVEHWTRHYRERGMRFVPLPESPINLRAGSLHMGIAYGVYLWLKSHDEFDIVHFPECAGHGFYALAAQRQGLILQNATTIVGLHSSSKWVRAASERLVRWEAELEDDFLERRSAEMADVVWSPGHYMLGWVREHGWDIRKRTHVQPLVVPAVELPAAGAGAPQPVSEIVFFGRQEVRKGLFLFLAAIDRIARILKGHQRPKPVVTILGKPTLIHGQCSEQIIRDRTHDSPFEVRVLSDRNEEQALNYLQGEGRLAVMPSLVDNYPNTVLECLTCQVPFLASRVGGIPEQIAAEDVDRVCFEPEVQSLTERLLDALDRGHAPARLSFDAEKNSDDWVRWHDELHQEFKVERTARSATIDSGLTGDPTISVCIPHRGWPGGLREPLLSILDQERSPQEVIVVAYANPDDDAQRELDVIEQEFDFAGRGWRLLRLEERYLGRACNRAAAAAQGDFLLFQDEGGIAMPDAVATFAAVARRSGADVFTCMIDVSHDMAAPGVGSDPDHRRLFTGANHPSSMLHNTFGDSVALFRRSAFLDVGGFSAEWEHGQEDWELFVRLMVSGYQIEVIPEALFCNPPRPPAAVQARPAQGNYMRTLRPHLESLPPAYHTLLELALGQSLSTRFPQNLPRLAEPPPPPPPPLRYRAVDGLNAHLKRVRLAHGLARALVHGILRARTLLRRRQLPAFPRKETRDLA